MTSDAVLRIVSIFCALILVAAALASRSRGMAGGRRRLIEWAIGWAAIFVIAAILLPYFT